MTIATRPVQAPAPGNSDAERIGVRVVTLLAGCLLALIGLVCVASSVTLGWIDRHRDDAGFVTTGSAEIRTPTAALTSQDMDVRIGHGGWLSRWLDDIRVQAISSGETPLFLGIAPSADIDRWLAGVAHDAVRTTSVRPLGVDYARRTGAIVPAAAPRAQTFWTRQTAGSGTLTLRWPLTRGRWTLVIANADGSPGVAARAEIGAEASWLGTAALGLAVAATMSLIGAGLLLYVAVRPRGGSATEEGSPA